MFCDAEFKSSRVKRSKQHMLKRDSDFCVHYKSENPVFYNVYVCPQCGYGFTDNFKPPSDEEKEKIKTAIDPTEDLCGPRSVEKAITAYQTALRCALLGGERDTIIAGLYLHLAWFNRFRKDRDEELKFLERAMEYYEKAIGSDRNLEDVATIFYLIGEISNRLGDDRKAVKFFAHIVHDKEINNPNIIRMARERWQEIRGAR
ncbi:MAG: DUF2225 domain-containing protein [Firmicutes bacterium]|nr:DUF2225 domain-containing protein [Bacillota bacterium]